MGRTVQVGSMEGYLGRPAGDGAWPAVIVIQEFWGLDDQTKTIVDRLAGLPEPYLAFAPDLYHGELALLGDREKAAALAQKYGPAAPEHLFQTFDALKAHQECNGRLGAVGFCFGGRMALLLGAGRPLDALCSFYGGGMQRVFDELGGLKSPVLGLYGEQDMSIPKGTIEEFEKLLDKLNVPHEVVIYPGAGHAFFRDQDANTYRASAAADAWERLQKFFTKYLRAA